MSHAGSMCGSRKSSAARNSGVFTSRFLHSKTAASRMARASNTVIFTYLPTRQKPRKQAPRPTLRGWSRLLQNRQYQSIGASASLWRADMIRGVSGSVFYYIETWSRIRDFPNLPFLKSLKDKVLPRGEVRSARPSRVAGN